MRDNDRSNEHSHYGLENHGLSNLNDIYWNLTTPALYEHVVRRREGVLAHLGPIIVRTGHHTGRSANDKFTVQESSSEKEIWWGKINRPFSAETFDDLHHRMAAQLQSQDVYVQDCYVGASPKHRMPIRIITQNAWHNLFARNMFLQASAEELTKHVPEFTVIQVPEFHANPEKDGTNSETFIIVNFAKKLVLIGGTSYGGEIKKSIFSVMNYLLPAKSVLPMHCSANIGADGNTAIFFGLSGTGKTTLSADASKTLIGDDEHGWDEKGIFNFEGGCYAKLIKLSPEAEPEIYETTRRFGTLLENVPYDPETRRVDLMDESLTENTRGSYPISHISNASKNGMGGHPRNVIFLSADAFGVLPPLAKLTKEQAMYHFLSGYTAKVAGTEKGITEPQPNFSTCYGAPFMPRHPQRYAELLGKKLDDSNADIWLINTGWSGGPYGVGDRIKIAYTRAMVNAVLDGKLKDVPLETEPFFGLQVPKHCPEVPDEILNPRNTWSNPADYDAQAKKLAQMFANNFKQYADEATPEILAAGPSA
ncbi:MAG: phosphoenolpyruvate carboxykinase (ATP) [Candidatus Parabeggiatoa sp. nov. 3]|nr:MAG: phosphoenolpyruvate carboxykinase (ATP) [Gammaproteobacteria bacterium]RKZ68763.1 MAG: phosphoenolpyruvate carboxykinase (ATP) [Gammaproteobacteria bacterium]RKZ82305.1 MAG: phosphoenolpyruvate carboxykinase (ATP) [Gammaproteobacteria bacterium]HEW98083.1 phosphoenolpyruvate carboxykinase (ATP) [Beggiatoa sp.]